LATDFQPMSLPRDLEYAVADLLARLSCAEAAARVCTGSPERVVETARELYAFVMEGAGEDFRQLVIQGRRA